MRLQTLFGPGSLFLNAAATAAADGVRQRQQGRRQFDQAAGLSDELLAEYRKTVVQAFTDMENAIDRPIGCATEQEALAAAGDGDIAQRAASIARAQMQAGTIDVVDRLAGADHPFTTDLDQLVPGAPIPLSCTCCHCSARRLAVAGRTVRRCPPSVGTVRPPDSLFQGAACE